MTETYKITRHFFNSDTHQTIKRGLTLEQAQEHCRDPETSSATCTRHSNRHRTTLRGPWFDGYDVDHERRK
jgi:hypothetical protein